MFKKSFQFFPIHLFTLIAFFFVHGNISAQGFVADCLSSFGEMPTKMEHKDFFDLIKKKTFLNAKTAGLFNESITTSDRLVPVGQYKVGKYAHCFYLRVRFDDSTGNLEAYNLHSKTIHTKTGDISGVNFHLLSYAQNDRYHETGVLEMLDNKRVRFTCTTIDLKEKSTDISIKIYKFGRNRIEFEERIK